MSLYGSAISMTEGTRFDTVFRRHLQAKVMMDFVVTVCFVRWFPCRLYVPSCIVLVLVALLVLQIASARLSVFVRPYNSLARLSSSLAQQCNIVL
jgi:hypothetical protein